MKYWNNFWANLSVKAGKSKYDIHNYTTIKLLENGVEDSVDNMRKTFNSINSANLKINNINELLSDLLAAMERNSWPDVVNQIIMNNDELQSNLQINNINEKKLINNTYPKQENHSLSQIEILSFCGKLLDYLNNGSASFNSATEKYTYLQTYFEVKEQIAKMQNILLVREILHREDNKKHNENNEQKIQKQKEELELVINANYLAFQSSIEEYKQLKKEIEDIDKNNNKINENNNQNKENIMKVNDANTIMFKLQEIETKINKENFEQPDSIFKNNNNKYIAVSNKQNLENQKHLLTKKLELCMLLRGIMTQIEDFIYVFVCKEQENYAFADDKNKCKETINEISLEYLTKMQNTIINDNDFSEDFHNQVSKCTSLSNNNSTKITILEEQQSLMDTLCCSICVNDPITYAIKDINSGENLDDILKKHHPQEANMKPLMQYNINGNYNNNNLFNDIKLNNINNDNESDKFDLSKQYTDMFNNDINNTSSEKYGLKFDKKRILTNVSKYSDD